MADFYQTNNTNKPDINPKAIITGVILFFGLIFFIVFWNKMTVTIDSGNVGVLFKTFGEGTVTDESYGEGFHFIAPWNKMVQYETRTIEKKEELDVLSNNGLNISIDVSVLYSPVSSSIGKLHAEIGPDYHDRIVMMNLRAEARTIFGRYTPEEIYSTKKDQINIELFTVVKDLLAIKYIDAKQVSIRSIKLPAEITKAIETKLKEKQAAEAYKFKLERAELEAQRQKIEAQGKADANKIVSASLTDKILTEKGIEATIRLAESPNAKTVVIGSGKDGLPLILGNN